MRNQRIVRIIAGLTIGASLYAAGPVLQAVANHSGNDARTVDAYERRGARASWTVYRSDAEGATVGRDSYSIWVWQERNTTLPDASASLQTLDGQVGASLTHCDRVDDAWSCQPQTVWRGEAVLEEGHDGDGVYQQDPDLTYASFRGWLGRGEDACRVDIAWQATPGPALTLPHGEEPLSITTERKKFGSSFGSTSCWQEPVEDERTVIDREAFIWRTSRHGLAKQ